MNLLAQNLPTNSQARGQRYEAWCRTDHFLASLEKYRETVQEQVDKELQDVQLDLAASIDDLTTKVEHHFISLHSIEEPLQRSFVAETLSIPAKSTEGNEGHQEALEVALKDRITEFRQLRQDKERTLCKLWEEWEQVQLELISLAAEILGPDSLSYTHALNEDLKPGQQEKWQKALEAVKGTQQEAHDYRKSLEEDLLQFEGSLAQITSSTKKTMTEMQQQYNIQKNKLVQGLHRHIELLASL